MRLLAFLLALVAGRLSAATLVVSQQDPHARDANDGSANAPLATITAAAQRVKPGDHVVVHAGEYRETVVITASGTEASPIVFEAAPGETVVIKGSDVLRDWKHDDAAVWRVALPPKPKVSGDKDPAFWRTNDVRQVFARDGVLGEADRLDRADSREALKPGSFFCDKASETLFVCLPDGGSPLEHPPEVSLRGAWLMIYADYVTVRGFRMRHASTTAFANWPAAGATGRRCTFEDCVMTWGDFAGVSLVGEGNQLLNCTVAYNGACGIGGSGTNHRIEGCR